jgi:hypothetical protein
VISQTKPPSRRCLVDAKLEAMFDLVDRIRK